MKERLKRLPIFNINRGLYPAIYPYPIQPYPMGADDYTGLPSLPYKNIVSCYHQMQINENISPVIYPSKGCAIVFVITHNKASSVLVGSPTIPRKAEYLCSECICFVAIFWPDAGYGLFPGLINETIDTCIPLEKIFSDLTPCFTEKMASDISFPQRVNIFETFLNRILTRYTPIPVRHKRLLNKICHFPDSSLANTAGKLIPAEFSGRHVQRLCVKYLGIAPKLLVRISRYQKTLHIMNMDPSVNLSDLAVEMGYSDQSHFIKEFKKFQKMTPVEFLSQFPGR
jgi:AraC-like DNA-binding protein